MDRESARPADGLGGAPTLPGVGRSGTKRSRKGGRRQHLPKVGTRDEARREQHLERSAIADEMGIGGAPGWLKVTAVVVGGVLVVLALAAFIGLF